MLNCKEIIVLALYGYILFKVLKPNQKMEMILLTVFTYFLLSNSNMFEPFEVPPKPPPTNIKKDSNVSGNTVSDIEKSKEQFADNLKMGQYDTLCLTTGNDESWMKSPDNTDLIPNDKLYSFLGSQGPVKMSLSDQAKLIGPPIDGKKGSPEKNFMLANNVASPACCPSTFSTSTGCVCTTKDQRDFISSRGVLGSETKNYEF